MTTKTAVTLYVVCRRCGHEREVERDDLLRGTWKRQPCPACGYRADELRT